MKEKLVIKNFGPIKSAELELGRFNVLIGEQATGKSTVAKLLAVCRYFSYIVDNHPVESLFEHGLYEWGLEEAIQDETYIYYRSHHYCFTARRVMEKITGRDDYGEEFEADSPSFQISLEANSSEFNSLLEEFKKLRSSTPLSDVMYNNLNWVPASFFINNVSQVMDNPFFLHTERGLQSIFSLGRSSIQNLSDALFSLFARLEKITRHYKVTSIEPLGLVYKNENSRGFIKKSGQESFYSLVNGASGYQSAIPIVLATKYYSEVRRKRKTFIVEEPELNLFPSAQHKLMQFLVDKIKNNGNSILLTTHSPYVLASLNNMIYAYRCGLMNAEETQKVVPEKYWINLDEVSVYMMQPDGSCEDIIDRDEGLIKSSQIDSVSEVINSEFDALLKLEFGGK
jgi:predicted ATPase